jgi:hypothetical protein
MMHTNPLDREIELARTPYGLRPVRGTRRFVVTFRGKPIDGQPMDAEPAKLAYVALRASWIKANRKATAHGVAA